MGQLDDAIREHLELKRRRGGDAGEIERLEQEAFGPIHHGEEPPPAHVEDDLHGDAVVDEPAAAEVPHPVAESEPFALEPLELEPEPEPTQAFEVEPVLPAAIDEDFGLGEDGPEPPPAARELPPLPEQSTVAFTLDEVESATAEPAPVTAVDPDVVAGDEEHDELEETPEFLQETPEHDRLWFEQKPPRDFDF